MNHIQPSATTTVKWPSRLRNTTCAKVLRLNPQRNPKPKRPSVSPKRLTSTYLRTIRIRTLATPRMCRLTYASAQRDNLTSSVLQPPTRSATSTLLILCSTRDAKTSSRIAHTISTPSQATVHAISSTSPNHTLLSIGFNAKLSIQTVLSKSRESKLATNTEMSSKNPNSFRSPMCPRTTRLLSLCLMTRWWQLRLTSVISSTCHTLQGSRRTSLMRRSSLVRHREHLKLISAKSSSLTLQEIHFMSLVAEPTLKQASLVSTWIHSRIRDSLTKQATKSRNRQLESWRQVGSGWLSELEFSLSSQLYSPYSVATRRRNLK